jgi:hypothetical protein
MSTKNAPEELLLGLQEVFDDPAMESAPWFEARGAITELAIKACVDCSHQLECDVNLSSADGSLMIDDLAFSGRESELYQIIHRRSVEGLWCDGTSKDAVLEVDHDSPEMQKPKYFLTKAQNAAYDRERDTNPYSTHESAFKKATGKDPNGFKIIWPED